MSVREVYIFTIRWLSLIILCMPLSVGQGNKYIRLPSGFTFPQQTSNYLQNPAQEGPPPPPPRNGAPVPPQAPPRAQAVEQPLQSVQGAGAQGEYAISPPPPPAPPFPGQPPVSPKESGYAQFKQMMMKKIEEMQNKEDIGVEGTKETKGGGAIHVASSAKDRDKVINNLHVQAGHATEAQRSKNLGNVLSTLGGGQFYQSLFGGRGGFSPLSFFLNGGAGRGGQSNFFVPVPIVVPPPPPPPPGPKCYTNPSGFLCCNVTLEKTIETSFEAVKEEGISLCNAQKMASAVQEAAQKKFGTSFETVVAHKDFVAKVNFAGDLNCKVEVDGKFILAYATPMKESEVNIIDANSFFSGDAEELFEGNGTEPGKPTYIVYGPI